MDLRSATAGEATDGPPSLPRQRWRLVLARAGGPSPLGGRELGEAFDLAVEATGLPLHRPARPSRSRVAFGAPLPDGMAAERELADITLTKALPIWRVREALTGRLPAGWTMVDLHDVWLGAPALAGRVTGAVYRVLLGVGAIEGEAGRSLITPTAIAAAAADLLGQQHLPRTRLKGGVPVTYDLRPLLAGVQVVEPGPPVVLRIQTRMHPELGTGRPEAVLAALGDRLGCPLGTETITRERLIVAADAG